MSVEADAATGDAFLSGRIAIRQPRGGHRTGLDGVMLAASVPARPGERVLEAGAGAAAAGLCLMARVGDIALTGVEIDEALVRLAGENAAANGFAGSANFIACDVTSPASAHAVLGLEAESFDHVFANPPFLDAGKSRVSPDAARALAHSLGADGLQGWLRFLTRMARPGGTVTLIHRADALERLLAAFSGRCGGLSVLPMHPRTDEPAHRVIVQGVKGSRAPARICPGLVLHDEAGKYRPRAEAILRGGAALEVLPDRGHIGASSRSS